MPKTETQNEPPVKPPKVAGKFEYDEVEDIVGRIMELSIEGKESLMRYIEGRHNE